MVFRYRISDRSLLKNVYSIVTPSYLSKKNRLLYLSVSGLSLASGIITDMYKEGCEKCLHSWLCPCTSATSIKTGSLRFCPFSWGPKVHMPGEDQNSTCTQEPSPVEPAVWSPATQPSLRSTPRPMRNECLLRQVAAIL